MRTSPRALLPTLSLLAAVGLVLAGCQSSSSSGGQSGSPGDGQQLAFTSPAADAKVTSPVRVSFNVTGAEIGRPETGKMHLHVHVDGSSQYEILYALKGAVKVPTGQHLLKAVLAQPNHTETSVTATRQVTVTGAGQAPTTTTGGGYSYP
ncbi:MAG TPA: hypothetical protein VFA46_07675 [Actinomycetes bacterium]|jgi:hypothetical protein|nr:hypothetical protein [Actinomycetes bacterium]